LISREKLVQLYSAMVKSRLIAERTTELAQRGKLPQHWEIGAGSEATLAGVTADLRPGDTLSAPGNRFLWSLATGALLLDTMETCRLGEMEVHRMCRAGMVLTSVRPSKQPRRTKLQRTTGLPSSFVRTNPHWTFQSSNLNSSAVTTCH